MAFAEKFSVKISVIIPLYNAEKTIEKTFDSIKKQTFKDYELVVINNCSSDSSFFLAENYKKHFENFTLLNTEIKGVGNARNLGISHAKGEYIAFVDADDFVSPRFLEVLYRNIIKNSEIDISCCGHCAYFPKINWYWPHFLVPKSGIHNSSKMLKMLLKDTKIHFHLWNKLFKKEMFLKHNICFPNSNFEDIPVVTKLFYHAKKISFNPKKLYFYTQNPKSITKNKNFDLLDNYINALENIKSFLKEKNLYNLHKSSFNYFCARSILTNTITILKIDKKNSAKNIFSYSKKIYDIMKDN